MFSFYLETVLRCDVIYSDRKSDLNECIERAAEQFDNISASLP